jgi:hypothetical protein
MEKGLLRLFAAEILTTALKDTPVVMVTGSPQTTWVRILGARDREFITMDYDTPLAAARNDPTGLVRNLDRSTIDEVQRARDLFRGISRSVDEDRRAGRFLLTGSASILALPQISESLAGPMDVVSLLPISQAEIRKRKPREIVAGSPRRPIPCRQSQSIR